MIRSLEQGEVFVFIEISPCFFVAKKYSYCEVGRTPVSKIRLYFRKNKQKQIYVRIIVENELHIVI